MVLSLKSISCLALLIKNVQSRFAMSCRARSQMAFGKRVFWTNTIKSNKRVHSGIFLKNEVVQQLLAYFQLFCEPKE